MISESDHAKPCERPMTADSSELPKAAHTSEVPKDNLNSSEVPTQIRNLSEVATKSDGSSEVSHAPDSPNMLKADESKNSTKKSSHQRDPAEDTERLARERNELEQMHLLTADRQMKDLCSNFLLPMVAFAFAVLGLLYVMSSSQPWCHFSSFFYLFVIFWTGFITEATLEELHHR